MWNIRNKTVCICVRDREKNITNQYKKCKLSFISRKHYYFKCCLLPITHLPYVGQCNIAFVHIAHYGINKW